MRVEVTATPAGATDRRRGDMPMSVGAMVMPAGCTFTPSRHKEGGLCCQQCGSAIQDGAVTPQELVSCMDVHVRIRVLYRRAR